MTEIEVRVRQNGKPYLRVRLSESPATIGRDPEADVHLDSTAVSRVHARLFFDGAGIRIVDAGSTNGIKIAQGYTVPAIKLDPQDVAPAPAAADTQPAKATVAAPQPGASAKARTAPKTPAATATTKARCINS